MAHYRVYCLDGTGKISSAEWLEAGSDEEAIEAAERLEKAVPCEVWERHRHVARIGAFAPATEAVAKSQAGDRHSPL